MAPPSNAAATTSGRRSMSRHGFRRSPAEARCSSPDGRLGSHLISRVRSTSLAGGNAASIAIAIVLAFFFGYLLTLRPLVTGGVPLHQAALIALAADTVSITVMEIVDNGFVLLVPGAMAAGLGDFLFWWSLAVSLFVAFWAAFPVNRLLIARGRGHAVVHELH